MRLFFHFVLSNFSNTYILGHVKGGDAIIIDPGVMDLQLLKLIEDNNLYIKNILVTHNHASHVNGIKTLRRIYDAEIYSHSDLPFPTDYNRISDGDILQLGDFYVDVMNIPGHSADSMVFRVANMLFTGDVLLAGLIDRGLTSFYENLLKKNIAERIFPLEDDLLIFPGHGAPTTIRAEKMFNPFLKES